MIRTFVLCLTALLAGAQTRIDLGRQGGANIDFSSATTTKPAKTGNSLPAACGVGEVFFSLTATPGQNLYGCTVLNTWSLEGVGGGSSTFPFAPSAASSVLLDIGGAAGAFGCNGVNYPIGAGNATVVPLSGTATESLLIGLSCVDQHLKVYAPSNGLTCTAGPFAGCDVVVGSNFTDGVIPLMTGNMVTDGAGSFTFASLVDVRAAFTDDPPTAGFGIAYSRSGNARTWAVDTTAVPTLGTNSDFVEISPPGAPASGRERFYAKAGAGVCAKDSGGTERCTGASTGLGALQYVSVPLTSAQIKNLVGTPVTLVAAPGANLAIEVVSVTLVYQFGTMAYTGGATTFVAYGNGQGTVGNVDTGFAATDFTAAASHISSKAVADQSLALSNVANQPVVTSNATTNFAAGDGIAWFHVAYRIIPTNG